MRCLRVAQSGPCPSLFRVSTLKRGRFQTSDSIVIPPDLDGAIRRAYMSGALSALAQFGIEKGFNAVPRVRDVGGIAIGAAMTEKSVVGVRIDVNLIALPEDR